MRMEYRFDVNSIKLEPITVEKKYPGTRFYFTAHMDTIAYNMSVDIGFGDVVTPYPKMCIRDREKRDPKKRPPFWNQK